MSPWRAINAPSHFDFEALVMIAPPCVEVSPSRQMRGMLSPAG